MVATLAALDAQILVVQAEIDAMEDGSVKTWQLEGATLRKKVAVVMLEKLLEQRHQLATSIATASGRPCFCNDWKRWERFLSEIQRRLGENIQGLDFVGNEFRFCPWCGAPR